MNIKKGNPLQKGSTKQKDGYNFAIASAAEIIDLLLYAPKADEPEYRIELTEAYKTGDEVLSMGPKRLVLTLAIRN